jgi:hypothetical protein
MVVAGMMVLAESAACRRSKTSRIKLYFFQGVEPRSKRILLMQQVLTAMASQ